MSVRIKKTVIPMRLKRIISRLQRAVANGGITRTLLKSTSIELSKLRHSYRHDKFPRLGDMSNIEATLADSPSSLAEALLWKMGKWQAYKSFVGNYTGNGR